MKTFLVAAILIAVSAGAAKAAEVSPYHHIDNPPDPAAHLAEMATLYERICLAAFPNDAAVGRAMESLGAAPLSKKEVKAILRDDPGVGWRISGRVAEYKVTIEAPPFHACGIRTMAAAPFPDMQPYRALATRFEAGKAVQPIGPLPFDHGPLHSIGAGEAWKTAEGGGESLLVFTVVVQPQQRQPGEDAVELRFVHQIAAPDAR